MKRILVLTLALAGCSGGATPRWFPYDFDGGPDGGDTEDTEDTSTETDTGTSDSDSDTDTTDTETESATDTESETEDTGSETEIEDTCPAGVASLDDSTGLCWQLEPMDAATLSWSDAIDYCEGLDLGGQTDWRLPSVSEMRSLVRGCSGNEISGSCAVTDDCLTLSCWSDATCPACATLGGPDGGCYWMDGLEGSCSLSWYWSSSTRADDPTYAWELSYNIGGRPGLIVKSTLLAARCVRGD